MCHVRQGKTSDKIFKVAHNQVFLGQCLGRSRKARKGMLEFAACLSVRPICRGGDGCFVRLEHGLSRLLLGGSLMHVLTPAIKAEDVSWQSWALRQV